MSCHKLPNYLRTHRKRVGFSQDDVARLLGNHSAAAISRYEHFHITPSLQTTLAFSIIFHTTVPELFAGDYQKVERMVRQNANRLAKGLATENPDPTTARKLAHLKTIISTPVKVQQP